MNDHDRRKVALDAAHRLRLATIALSEDVDGLTVLDRIRANEGHLRSSRPDGSRSGATISDPTASTAGLIDRAHHDMRKLDRNLRLIANAVRQVEAVIDSYPPPRLASELDRLALERLNITPDPGCESCARLEGTRGGPRWEPVSVRCMSPTTVAGRLAEPMLLCTWCYDAVERWGRCPSIPELQRHHRGERVPWPADVPKPA